MQKSIGREDAEVSDRFRVTEFDPGDALEGDGDDVITGLTEAQKWLPARYFYDDRGSALFEQITELPEYYLTRSEEAILAKSSGDIARRTGACELIELGSGSARKTRILLDAYAGLGHQVRYLPIDVSAGILKSSAGELLATFPALEIWGLIGTYGDALTGLPERTLPQRMVIFLGSTIGNLNNVEMAAFLAIVRGALAEGEYFLVGADLQKPIEIIEAAYNDAGGVTVLFNLNMLEHLNRRFDGDFDLAKFSHRAVYDRRYDRIEMHLVSSERQSVNLAKLDLVVEFAAGETILTEISRKFDLPSLRKRFAEAGFAAIETWTDPDQHFSLTLFRAE
ncbi:MAG: L-histidine N(alpha)-methyltransferase [Alphaproteobacteria bacterium]|nr:L-histidine N(alpha)-methyltransferase [Alphaproteobacteria bacterium]